ncbi:hypothetical protein [Frigoribacterium salinisoli]
MARITSFEPGAQEIQAHPSEVTCFHQIVLDSDGKRFLHLSTFGSQDRASKPKSSQSIQVGEEEAQELVQILLNAFPGIRSS